MCENVYFCIGYGGGENSYGGGYQDKSRDKGLGGRSGAGGYGNGGAAGGGGGYGGIPRKFGYKPKTKRI